MSLYWRLRWWLRRILPLPLTADQAALYNAVIIHACGGGDPARLLPHLADQMRASAHDRRVVAYLLRINR